MNERRPASNDTLDFLRHTTSNAIMSSYEVRQAAERGGLKSGAGPGPNRDPLQTVAALIRGDLATRIYYVATSGFDTHANQLGTQDQLLLRFSEALARFRDTLKRDGTSDRVLILVFSEFGRRVEQNASGGTDHGTAAPMFLIGDRVKGGLYGPLPNLADLENGDLKFAVDFRSVYASVLKGWFDVEPQRVLGKPFETMPLIA
jgi:uncharacterized protein (DUF1501 family)